VTVLLADQNLMFARAVADRALVMERGRLVHAASRAELAGNDPRSTAISRLTAREARISLERMRPVAE